MFASECRFAPSGAGVAVVSDGTRVLELGDIEPEAAHAGPHAPSDSSGSPSRLSTIINVTDAFFA
jgi:hypothetical protein